MREIIDFTEAEILLNGYGGSERKSSMRFRGKVYMVKSSDPTRNERLKLSLGYINNHVSEDIGCRVMKSLNISTQNTFIVRYRNVDGQERIGVACEDFIPRGEFLREADKIARSFASTREIMGADYENITHVFNLMNRYLIGGENPEKWFWNVFVADALIGNCDRHMGNWGCLSVDAGIGKKYVMAPVYDCGSSLAATMSDRRMEEILPNKGIFKSFECNIAASFSMNGKRVYYHEIFSNPPPQLRQAILDIVPRVNMDEIHQIVKETPYMSDIRKEYLCQAMEIRCDEILFPALQRVKDETYRKNYATLTAASETIKKDFAAGLPAAKIVVKAERFMFGNSKKARKANLARAVEKLPSDLRKHIEKLRPELKNYYYCRDDSR